MAETDVVGKIIASGSVERGSTQKGKEPLNSKKPAAKGDRTKMTESSKIEQFETKLFQAINCIKEYLEKQEHRLQNQNQELKAVTSRLSNMEQSYDQVEYFDYDEGMLEDSQSPTPEEDGVKRKSEEESNSRFKNLSKRFKNSENCDKAIDSSLAENVTEFFRNGIDYERYEDLIKDENNARPENCEGLVVVRLNQLIWDAVTPLGKTTDKKMQNIETSVIKAATILAKSVDKMDKFAEKIQDEYGEEFNSFIDGLNDALALLGHSNKQINTTRKDFLKPELNKEYIHLCSHARPFSSLLFGDDLSKSAREIEDCSKISSRIITPRPARTRFMRGGNRGRFRGNYPYNRGRGRGFYQTPMASTSWTNNEAKNFPRRGGRPYRN